MGVIRFGLSLFLSAFMLSAVMAAAPYPGTPSQYHAKGLAAAMRCVARFKDDSFAVREKASADILELDEAAIEVLENSCRSNDVEVRRRSERALDKVCQDLVERARVPSIFVLPPAHNELIYLYYKSTVGSEHYYPIEERLGWVGKWIREELMVAAGQRERPFKKGVEGERLAMAILISEMRVRLGDRRTYFFLKMLPTKQVVPYDPLEFGTYRYRTKERIEALDNYAIEIANGGK